MKKTLLTIFLAVIMLVTLVLPASAATGNLSTTASLSKDRTSFTVELIVNDNPGIIAMTAAVSYDSSVLKLKSADNGKIFESIFMPSQSLTANPYKLIWMEATASEDIKENGVLATYTFEVLNSAAIGQTEIKFEIPEVVNYKKDNSASFKGCSFKVNVSGVAGDNQNGGQNGDVSNAGTVGTASGDKVTNDQTLDVQKPIADNSVSDTETVVSETSSLTESISSDTESEIADESDEDDVEGKDRTMVTLITIAAVLVAGICITFVALYFRKKSQKSGSNSDNQE